MNVVSFSDGACARIRKYLDYYLSNELSVETSHEVMKHLEQCASCRDELAARSRLRARLQAAVRQEKLPPGVKGRIQKEIRRRGLVFSFASFTASIPQAVAAGVLLFAVLAGTWKAVQWWRDRVYTNPGVQATYIESFSTLLPALESVGLRDHLHCAVLRKFPQQYPKVPVAVQSLGPEYLPLVDIVREKVPGDFHVVMAHRCSYAGRKYVHFVLKRGPTLMSVVITDKQAGEFFDPNLLRPYASDGSGVPVYQATAKRFRVAGFESQSQLAFVISDLGEGENLQIATSLAPALRDYLNKIKI